MTDPPNLRHNPLTPLPLAEVVDARVRRQGDDSERYMRALGLPEDAVRARRVADEVCMREKLAWTERTEPSWAALCVEMQEPLRMDPDEVEAIMRTGTWLDHYLDDREAEYQVHQARVTGYPCIFMITCQPQPRCEGPATLIVHERDEKWEREWPATRAKFTADIIASLNTEAARLATRKFIEAMSKEPTPKIY